MTDRSRSIFVGLTFLAALALTMVGIFYLGKFPAYGGIRQYDVILHANDANGVVAGSHVEYNGMYAGQVAATWISADQNGHAIVNILMKIDPGIDIPVSATVILQRPPAVGNPFVVIKTSKLTPPFLSKNPKDGTAVLDATAGDSGLIPNSITDNLTTLSNNLNNVAVDLHTMLAYTPPEALEHVDPNNPNRPRANATTLIVRLDQTVASLQSLLTDPKVQGNVRDSLQNIADASAHLKAILTKFDATVAKFDGVLDNAGGALTSINGAATQVGGAATQANATLAATGKQIDRVAQQLVETLAQLDKSIKQATEGHGTTGQLINDPRLYESLNDLAKSLKSTVNDLDFLLSKWKDEGVNLKLK